MTEQSHPHDEFAVHRLSWADFDGLARGEAGADVVRRLRRAERSRRLLLLRALTDAAVKAPQVFGPLPSPDDAWELLARVQAMAPGALDLILDHPYTGSWAGYTTRLVMKRISGVCPVWMHVGHLHALAAAAAIRAGLPFRTQVPVWKGGAVLPTLGMAELPVDSPWSVADVRGDGHRVEVSNESGQVSVPPDYFADAFGWCGIPCLTMRADDHVLSVHLDTLDPYRGLYEPVCPQRLEAAEVNVWRVLFDETWRLIVRYLPGISAALAAGLDSVVPRPPVPFRMPSASTGEAFGSAIISRPSDAVELAATLVHEFQHIRLGGLLHLTPLHADDSRERFYTPWRDDPRPIAGVLQGVYAFFGVTALWRALADAGPPPLNRRATFEFAHWRASSWRVLQALRDDPSLTEAGRRFVAGIGDVLGAWQDEPVPDELTDLVEAVAADHYAGWRVRHLRPRHETVTELVDAWLAGRTLRLTRQFDTDRAPTPVPDGTWSAARTDLIRLGATDTDIASPANRRHALVRNRTSVPSATEADFAYVTGRFTDAVRGYRAELGRDPDRPASWIGLGLALSQLGAIPAARTLVHYPEVVRAVHRRLRTCTDVVPTPDDLAAWIGRFLF